MNQRTALGYMRCSCCSTRAARDFFGVIRHDRHRRLNDYWPAIHLRSNEMHRTAMYFYPFFQRLPVRVKSGKSGQQRRMDIHQSALIARDKTLFQNVHEAGERDQVRFVRVDCLRQRGIERLSIRVRPLIHYLVSIPCLFATSSPCASGRLLITALILADRFASIKACILLPRPEMRITRDFTISADGPWMPRYHIIQ